MQAQALFVAFQSTGETALCLSGEAQASPIVMDEFDFDGVQHAVGNLKNDLLAVTGQKHEVGYSIPNHSVSSMLIVGSLPKSKLIRELADRGKIDGKALDGCYEKYMVQVVEQLHLVNENEKIIHDTILLVFTKIAIDKKIHYAIIRE